MSHAAPTTSAATTVQITIQPPKSVAEINPRPLLSQPPKPLAQQPIMQPTHITQQHKVVGMSQATVTPIMQPGAVNPPKLGKG